MKNKRITFGPACRVHAYLREIHLAVQEREGAKRETEFPGVRRMYLERMRFWAKLATMHGWRGPVHSPFQLLQPREVSIPDDA